MGQIKTKKELLDGLYGCCAVVRSGSEQESIIKKYYALIKSVLAGFKDDEKLPAFESLSFSNKISDFVGMSLSKDLDDRLKTIHNNLFEWVTGTLKCDRAIVELNAVRELQREAIQSCVEYQNNRRKFVWYKIVMVALIVVAVVFTILSFFERFKGWSEYVSASIGVVDLALGIIFQIYERKDDMKQRTKTGSLNNEIATQAQLADQSIVQNATKIINISQSAGDNATQTITFGNN